MRIYLTCKEAITDIGRELKKCATNVHTATYQNKKIEDDPNFETKELQAFEFMIINTDDKDQMPGVTKEWCMEEFLERIDATTINPGDAYKLRPEVWGEFLVEKNVIETSADGEHELKPRKVFDYTYSERIAWQLPAIVEELRLRPATRQAIVEVHNNQKDLSSLGGRERIPCSLMYQFMIRDGKLDVIYLMRSTDFATHFQNDIWLADELRRFIAAQVNVPVGKFIMFASSLHVYKKDWDTLKNY